MIAVLGGPADVERDLIHLPMEPSSQRLGQLYQRPIVRVCAMPIPPDKNILSHKLLPVIYTCLVDKKRIYPICVNANILLLPRKYLKSRIACAKIICPIPLKRWLIRNHLTISIVEYRIIFYYHNLRSIF